MRADLQDNEIQTLVLLILVGDLTGKFSFFDRAEGRDLNLILFRQIGIMENKLLNLGKTDIFIKAISS